MSVSFIKKSIIVICTTCLMCGLLSACSSVIDNKDIVNADAPERIQSLQEDKTHRLGEMAPRANPVINNPLQIGAEYTVKTAVLYEHPEDAGINVNQMIETEGCFDMETGEVYFPDLSKTSFLLCDVSIKNLCLEYMNITDLSLVCLADGNEKLLKLTGYPVFFSKPEEVEDKVDYYNFNLPINKSIDVQVGWWVDLEQYKKENLYLMLNYGGDSEFHQFWELGL